MKRCALYVRMSTDKQEHSAENQIQVLEGYARRNDLKVVKTYSDEGISGTKAEKRPAFMRMIEDSSRDIFDIVLIYDSSRFARNLTESLIYKAELRKNNVSLISITEPNLDDDSSLLIDAVLGASNELYSRKLSKSVTRGMVFYVERGNFATPPPFGYRKSGGVTTIDETEAKLVNIIFKAFTDKPSWHSVAVMVNDMGYRTRKGAMWGSRDIKRVLMNPAYIGQVQFQGKTYKGVHKPIVPNELWEEVQTAISNKPYRYRAKPENRVKHWLSGVAKCGHCGGAMTYTTPKRGSTFFRCHASANGKCKHTNFILVSKLEDIVLDSLKELLILDDLKNINVDMRPKIPVRDNSENLKDVLKKVKNRLTRHKEAYAAGVDSLEEYKINKAKCESEIAEISEKIKAAEETSVTDEKIIIFRSRADDLLSILSNENMAIEDKNISVKSLISKIIVNRETGEIRAVYYL